jgi:hypothetical protein
MMIFIQMPMLPVNACSGFSNLFFASLYMLPAHSYMIPFRECGAVEIQLADHAGDKNGPRKVICALYSLSVPKWLEIKKTAFVISTSLSKSTRSVSSSGV